MSQLYAHILHGVIHLWFQMLPLAIDYKCYHLAMFVYTCISIKSIQSNHPNNYYNQVSTQSIIFHFTPLALCGLWLLYLVIENLEIGGGI